MSDLPKFHIATKQGEIDAHGPHADGVAKTSYGSHQIRVNPFGFCYDDQHNFSNDFLGHRHGGFGLDADPRCTGMGGYAPRKY